MADVTDGKRELSMATVPIGSTVFVQACARMMSAAWIERQMLETSTAPGMSTSGVAYALRHTIASDIGMGFELALKSLAQGLSPNKDGDPQVPHGHNLPDVWLDLPRHVRDEIDRNVEHWFTEGFRAERDEARALMDRAAHQMTGRLGIMTEQELTDQRLRQ